MTKTLSDYWAKQAALEATTAIRELTEEESRALLGVRRGKGAGGSQTAALTPAPARISPEHERDQREADLFQELADLRRRAAALARFRKTGAGVTAAEVSVLRAGRAGRVGDAETAAARMNIKDKGRGHELKRT